MRLILLFLILFLSRFSLLGDDARRLRGERHAERSVAEKSFRLKTQTPSILPGGKIEGASFSSSINHTR
jgi:hypothetical protein